MSCRKYRKTKAPKCDDQEGCYWVVREGCKNKPKAKTQPKPKPKTQSKPKPKAKMTPPSQPPYLWDECMDMYGDYHIATVTGTSHVDLNGSIGCILEDNTCSTGRSRVKLQNGKEYCFREENLLLSKPKAKTQPKAKAKAKAKTQPKAKAKAKAKTQPKAKAKSKAKTNEDCFLRSNYTTIVGTSNDDLNGSIGCILEDNTCSTGRKRVKLQNGKEYCFREENLSNGFYHPSPPFWPYYPERDMTTEHPVHHQSREVREECYSDSPLNNFLTVRDNSRQPLFRIEHSHIDNICDIRPTEVLENYVEGHSNIREIINGFNLFESKLNIKDLFQIVGMKGPGLTTGPVNLFKWISAMIESESTYDHTWSYISHRVVIHTVIFESENDTLNFDCDRVVGCRDKCENKITLSRSQFERSDVSLEDYIEKQKNFRDQLEGWCNRTILTDREKACEDNENRRSWGQTCVNQCGLCGQNCDSSDGFHRDCLAAEVDLVHDIRYSLRHSPNCCGYEFNWTTRGDAPVGVTAYLVYDYPSIKKGYLSSANFEVCDCPDNIINIYLMRVNLLKWREEWYETNIARIADRAFEKLKKLYKRMIKIKDPEKKKDFGAKCLSYMTYDEDTNYTKQELDRLKHKFIEKKAYKGAHAYTHFPRKTDGGFGMSVLSLRRAKDYYWFLLCFSDPTHKMKQKKMIMTVSLKDIKTSEKEEMLSRGPKVINKSMQKADGGHANALIFDKGKIYRIEPHGDDYTEGIKMCSGWQKSIDLTIENIFKTPPDWLQCSGFDYKGILGANLEFNIGNLTAMGWQSRDADGLCTLWRNMIMLLFLLNPEKSVDTIMNYANEKLSLRARESIHAEGQKLADDEETTAIFLTEIREQIIFFLIYYILIALKFVSVVKPLLQRVLTSMANFVKTVNLLDSYVEGKSYAKQTKTKEERTAWAKKWSKTDKSVPTIQKSLEHLYDDTGRQLFPPGQSLNLARKFSAEGFTKVYSDQDPKSIYFYSRHNENDFMSLIRRMDLPRDNIEDLTEFFYTPLSTRLGYMGLSDNIIESLVDILNSHLIDTYAGLGFMAWHAGSKRKWFEWIKPLIQLAVDEDKYKTRSKVKDEEVYIQRIARIAYKMSIPLYGL